MKIITKDYKTGDSLIIAKEERQNWRLKKTVKEWNLITYYYEHTKNLETFQGNLFAGIDENNNECGNKRRPGECSTSNANRNNALPHSQNENGIHDRTRQMGSFDETIQV